MKKVESRVLPIADCYPQIGVRLVELPLR